MDLVPNRDAVTFADGGIVPGDETKPHNGLGPVRGVTLRATHRAHMRACGSAGNCRPCLGLPARTVSRQRAPLE